MHIPKLDSPVGMLLLVTLGTFIAWRPAHGAQAIFSKDASHAYFLVEDKPELVEIDLGAATCREVDLAPAITEPVEGITLSNSGFVLCLTSDALWSYNPATSKCVNVCKAPSGVDLQDIAYDPKTGEILAVGTQKTGSSDGSHWSILCLPKNANQFQDVGTRYDTAVGHPVFSADGTLFFVDDHADLWEGVLAKEDRQYDGPPWSLVAYRWAPLAFLIEENTSPPSTGLRDIAVSQHCVYANYARLGGSGWGAVLRMDRPKSLATYDSGDWSVSDANEHDWKNFKAVFDSVEELSDNPGAYLCASMDGSTTIFADPYDDDESDKVYLIKDDSKPEPIEIKGLSACFK
jgi:hypothetical protein